MEENLRLDGKIAAITGAASGIGRETAALFARHGASIALLDMDIDKLNIVCKEIGDKAKAHRIDITDERDVRSAFEQIESAFGKIDILVNCAGIFAPGTAVQTDYAQWKKILAVNLDGAFLCSAYAAESMLRRDKGGSIINIASEAGLVGIAGQVAYNVSKAGMISLTKSMAVDHALDGIRVNCVCPGRVLTPLVQSLIDNSENPDETMRELSNDRPVMRMGNPRDIAYACLSFADGSMPYATGAVMSVDGGYTAR